MGMIGMIFICRHVDGEPTPDNRETDEQGTSTEGLWKSAQKI
jgi:hypothetical protein